MKSFAFVSTLYSLQYSVFSTVYCMLFFPERFPQARNRRCRCQCSSATFSRDRPLLARSSLGKEAMLLLAAWAHRSRGPRALFLLASSRFHRQLPSRSSLCSQTGWCMLLYCRLDLDSIHKSCIIAWFNMNPISLHVRRLYPSEF